MSTTEFVCDAKASTLTTSGRRMHLAIQTRLLVARGIGALVHILCFPVIVVADVTRESTGSLASSILRYRQENGRTYHAYKDGS